MRRYIETPCVKWRWDEAKNRSNKSKHGLSFETAELVFRDVLAASCRDPFPGEERWRTVGCIGSVVVLVVHTWPDETGGVVGRIISARKATSRERRVYEEGRF